jgi:hypothetical protein
VGGEDLRGQGCSKEERAGRLKLVAEDGKRGSCIEVVEDMRREGVRGESFGKGPLHGISGSRIRAAELELSEAELMTVVTG